MAVNWANIAYNAAVNANHPDPHMFVRQMQAESGLRPGLTSSAGATGIAQIMPSTAKGWGVDPNDPVASLNAAAKAMNKYLRQYNDPRKALAAYNAGVGAVAKYNGVPPYKETENYIAKILGAQGSPARPGATQAPRSQQAAPHQDPVALSNQINRIQYAYMDSPDAAIPHVDKLMSAYQGGLANNKGPVVGNASPAKAEGQGFFKRNPGETFQVYMDRLLQKKFGLQHDPGNNQTTGGQHSAGSAHYRGGATDYGNARNPENVLSNAVKWTNANADRIVGFDQTIWQAEDHYDHAHWQGRKKTGNKTKALTPPPMVKPSNAKRRPRKRSK